MLDDSFRTQDTCDYTMTTATDAATNYWTSTAFAVGPTACHHDDDNDDNDDNHDAPYNFKLTPEERAKKSGQHQFGLCESCDTGLDDRADFHCYFNDNKMVLTCNACDSYFDGGGAS
jgi:hypothetical protein